MRKKKKDNQSTHPIPLFSSRVARRYAEKNGLDYSFVRRHSV